MRRRRRRSAPRRGWSRNSAAKSVVKSWAHDASCIDASPGPRMQISVASMQRQNPLLADLQWDDVRLFLALCRSRTVGLAGRSLKIDASTVSHRLAVLETTLGAALFDRGRDGIAPTEAAERLLPVAEEIEQGVA